MSVPEPTTALMAPAATLAKQRFGALAQRVRVRERKMKAGATGGTMASMLATFEHVRRDPVVRVPHFFIWDRPSDAFLFANDGANELSTAEEEASGKLTFRRARCGPRLRIRVRVDATLGSEFSDGEPMRVRGVFAASK